MSLFQLLGVLSKIIWSDYDRPGRETRECLIDKSGFGFQTVFCPVVESIAEFNQHFWLQACMPFGQGDLLVMMKVITTLPDVTKCEEVQAVGGLFGCVVWCRLQSGGHAHEAVDGGSGAQIPHHRLSQDRSQSQSAEHYVQPRPSQVPTHPQMNHLTEPSNCPYMYTSTVLSFRHLFC